MKIILIVLLLIFSSCLQQVKQDPQPQAQPIPILPIDYNKEVILPNQIKSEYGYKVLTIDSCEYIYTWFGGYHGGGSLTHKGNCKYCEYRKIKLVTQKLSNNRSAKSNDGEYSFFNLFKF